MKVAEKYKNIFGQIDSLAQAVPWSTGVSNMLEWLTWSTNDVLGVTKTRYRKLIVELSHDHAVRDSSLEEKQGFVKAYLDKAIQDSERSGRYDKPSSLVASPREALRRAKYFSEDYLNKEFDIFWGLVSDKFLDEFYGQFTRVNGGGRWFSHGNSGLFWNSTGIWETQMDNLSYNPDEQLLVANELKLGGKKNPDQILKYSLMYRLLEQREFIPKGTRFLLMFIGDRLDDCNWHGLIDKEIAYCQKSDKSTSKMALHPEGMELARNAEYSSTTWNELVAFNQRYMSSLDELTQQVEHKLLWGFNESLSAKAFMRSGQETAVV